MLENTLYREKEAKTLGFIPYNLIELLESPVFSDREFASKKFAVLISESPIDHIDIYGLFTFLVPFFKDENFGVVKCFADVVKGLITRIQKKSAEYTEQFYEMVFNPLFDARRAVRSLVIDLFYVFCIETQSYDLLSVMLPTFELFPSQTKTEIIVFITELLNKIRPPDYHYHTIISYLDISLPINSNHIHKASVQLLNRLVEVDESVNDLFPMVFSQYINEDFFQNATPMSTPQSARKPQSPVPIVIPTYQSMNIFAKQVPQTPKHNKVHIRTSPWGHSKPRLTKTATEALNMIKTPSFSSDNPEIYSSNIDSDFCSEPPPRIEITKVDSKQIFETLDMPLNEETPRRRRKSHSVKPKPIEISFDNKDEIVPGVQSNPSIIDDEQILPPQENPSPPRRRPKLIPSKIISEIVPEENIEPLLSPQPPENEIPKSQNTVLVPKSPRPRREPPRRAQSEPNIGSYIQELQSSDWEVQSQAISKIKEMVPLKPQFLASHIRTIMLELIQPALSNRTALSKNALECILELTGAFGNEFGPFYEVLLKDMLTLVSSSRIFIAKLARDCISSIIDRIPRKKAFEYLTLDHRKRPPVCRAHLAQCLESICNDVDDPTVLFQSIGWSITDASPESRKIARNTLKKLTEKFPHLRLILLPITMNEMEKKALIAAID